MREKAGTAYGMRNCGWDEQGDRSAKGSDVTTVDVFRVADWLLFRLNSVRVNDQHWSLRMHYYVFCHRAKEGLF